MKLRILFQARIVQGEWWLILYGFIDLALNSQQEHIKTLPCCIDVGPYGSTYKGDVLKTSAICIFLSAIVTMA